ncbi:MAG: 3-hydroxybutyryl-CoA dehydrogenase [Candidatus Syntrophoarchaeum caldarius]|uniref:3-hydroxybutyryl-CoA dehydrogenase n=1 Tax=Candidatus Syntropharchaeum caldarium TaxID=1838285 RepID=A0A1F2PAA4_9EURY|nr:MAG: 3-hydroxybutyryl-CoA dehydrogenase [Candidatus Syntrophoarchaeum caldarius]
MVVKDIKRVLVLGIGVMGNGIVQSCASAGYDVTVVDVSDEILERGLSNIKKSLGRFVKSGKMTQDEADAIFNRITPTLNLEEAAKAADYVIEAVTEKLEIKEEIFRKLDENCREGVILGSNTSTLPIAALGAVTERPELVIGTHFMNPPPLMKGVEIIRSIATSDETTEITNKFIESLGKVPIVVKDSPGFITNRLLFILLNEAARTHAEGLSGIEDADTLLKLCFNWPMGPFELMDLIGLDTCVFVLDSIYKETGNPTYAPAPILREYMRSGWLGRKSGRGWYDYSK